MLTLLKSYPSHRHKQHSTCLRRRQRNHPSERSQRLRHSVASFRTSCPFHRVPSYAPALQSSLHHGLVCDPTASVFARIFYCITWTWRFDHEKLVYSPELAFVIPSCVLKSRLHPHDPYILLRGLKETLGCVQILGSFPRIFRTSLFCLGPSRRMDLKFGYWNASLCYHCS
jgi:hypothetical protein